MMTSMNEENGYTITVIHKSAKEMFEELGFKRFTITNKCVNYYKEGLEICFNIDEKTIDINTDSGERIFGNKIYEYTSIDFEILQAINKQVEELGWYK